jgi:hypothetical protein
MKTKPLVRDVLVEFVLTIARFALVMSGLAAIVCAFLLGRMLFG